MDRLNLLAGFSEPSDSAATPAQKSCLAKVWRKSVDFSAANKFCPEGAVRELLGSSSGYEAEGPPSTLASYEEALVSLPSGERPPVPLPNALEGVPRKFLDGDSDWLFKGAHANSIDSSLWSYSKTI